MCLSHLFILFVFLVLLCYGLCGKAEEDCCKGSCHDVQVYGVNSRGPCQIGGKGKLC